MRSLLTAVGLFTVIPVRPFEVDRGAARRAMAAFPWLGLLLGAAAGLLLVGAGALGSPLVGVVAALALLAGVTGALHLDGVADTADGLGSRKPAEEALEIMRRSDIGPMGVVTLVFVLLADFTALLTIPWDWTGAAALACAVMVSRTAVMVASTSTKGARERGFGALFVGVTGRGAAALNVAAVAVVVVALGWLTGGLASAIAFPAAGALAAVVAWLWARHLRRRLGGWTGDTFGSLIEVSQAAYLVAAALLVSSLQPLLASM